MFQLISESTLRHKKWKEIRKENIFNQSNSTRSSEMNAITEQCLHAHNEYRSKHGAPPLVISESVKKFFKRISIIQKFSY